MADIYTTATQLAILQAGRTPVWTTQAAAGQSSAPDSALDGTYLELAARTLIHVSLRAEAHRRTCTLTIPTFVNSGTYTVTVNGNAVNVSGVVADKAALVAAIVAAVNADGTVGPLVTAAPSGSPADTIVITGDSEADYSIAFAHSGAAVVACVADLCHANLWLWWQAGARVDSTPPTVWVCSGDAVPLDRRGYVERLDSAGLDRLFLQVSDRVGHLGDGGSVTYNPVACSVGPCLSEVEVT